VGEEDVDVQPCDGIPDALGSRLRFQKRATWSALAGGLVLGTVGAVVGYQAYRLHPAGGGDPHTGPNEGVFGSYVSSAAAGGIGAVLGGGFTFHFGGGQKQTHRKIPPGQADRAAACGEAGSLAAAGVMNPVLSAIGTDVSSDGKGGR